MITMEKTATDDGQPPQFNDYSSVNGMAGIKQFREKVCFVKVTSCLHRFSISKDSTSIATTPRLHSHNHSGTLSIPTG